ncbi:hypothetical protein NDU88_009981 [Pleurodeles waltl]|uniref:Uncharacterized protein n=1 Tax=Pleurodeles waltl TaxID=8319 RepID=A0AAV7PTL5_PLEWA|nr:hypothetical protein NDU88_009981 [Pleurodeles waltl]
MLCGDHERQEGSEYSAQTTSATKGVDVVYIPQVPTKKYIIFTAHTFLEDIGHITPGSSLDPPLAEHYLILQQQRSTGPSLLPRASRRLLDPMPIRAAFNSPLRRARSHRPFVVGLWPQAAALASEPGALISRVPVAILGSSRPPQPDDSSQISHCHVRLSSPGCLRGPSRILGCIRGGPRALWVAGFYGVGDYRRQPHRDTSSANSVPPSSLLQH